MYKENQYNWLFLIVFTIFFIFISIILIKDSADLQLVYLTGAIFLICYLLFYKMTIIIDKEFITIGFSIFVYKKIALLRIKEVNIVKIRWYELKTIRGIEKFTINGNTAIELEDKISENKIRIGTKNPERLKNIIEERIYKLTEKELPGSNQKYLTE